MKLSLAYSALAAAVAVNGQCNANNCARAVTGTRAGIDQAVHRSDCSSFMLATVTPPTFTSTIYETVTASTETQVTTVQATVSVTTTLPIIRRQVTVRPSNVPSYATACSGTAKYSSACSCWGITQTTTMAPTPTQFITVTVSVTATTLVTATRTTTVVVTETPSCGSNGFCINCSVGSGCNAMGCGNNCICITTPESGTQGVCIPLASVASCAAQRCSRSVDCPIGYICDSANCCGYGICTRVGTVCPNNLAAARLFSSPPTALGGDSHQPPS